MQVRHKPTSLSDVRIPPPNFGKMLTPATAPTDIAPNKAEPSVANPNPQLTSTTSLRTRHHSSAPQQDHHHTPKNQATKLVLHTISSQKAPHCRRQWKNHTFKLNDPTHLPDCACSNVRKILSTHPVCVSSCTFHRVAGSLPQFGIR